MAIGTTAAILGSAVIGAGASVAAGNAQAKAAKNAARTAAQTASQEMALQREARDEARKVLTPYATEGASARRMYNAALGIAPSGGGAGYTEADKQAIISAMGGISADRWRDVPDWQIADIAKRTGLPVGLVSQVRNDIVSGRSGQTAGADTLQAARAAYDAGFESSPYWRDAQYGSQEAMNALISTNAAAGRGGSINSGKAMRAASDILTGYRGGATQNYLAALGGVADTGFAADSGIASGGQVYANNAGNALRNAAGIQANAAMAQGQAYANMGSNIAGLAAYGLGNLGGGQNYFSAYQAPSLQPIRTPPYIPLSTPNPAYSFGGG